ncbi:hypothetical protein AN958_12271 [Leucoagaricus sp. SymC.cos]|nr:hypothetical protein AN958_12271 [Leucoagaricus sp. SymC.cos]
MPSAFKGKGNRPVLATMNMWPTLTLHELGFFKNASRLLFWRAQMTDEIMKDLATHTIPGVEHDSSERDPPPQCHPGTRLDICGQAHTWFHDPKRKAKILWIHGPAGVGKSAIMQTLAQEDANSPTSILGATVFFSKLRQRNDPKKLFNTVAYQLATRYKNYRRYITDILTKDPKTVEKSMQEQFRRFIIVPFAEQHLFQGSRLPVLIILDGLDEVEEPHIMNAFSHSQIRSSYWTIKIAIDSNKGRADVEKFLRDRFKEVRSRYASMLQSNTPWPSEVDFLKVANASSGHFVFAELVSRFIIDETYGNPVSQLRVIIAAIEATPSATLRSNPLASLDNLYERILSTIPSDIRPITMHLLALSFKTSLFNKFWLICNWLELSQTDAYGALRKFHSVLRIPPPKEVDGLTRLGPFHKSFSDYILSPTRSGQYHIPDSLKSMLVGAVRALSYESHNSLKFTVQSSRIKVSWAYKDDIADLQADLFFWSFVAVINHIGDAINCEDDAAHTNGRLVAFFRDIDYADFFNSGRTYTVGNLLRRESSAGIFPVLEDWGLARPITISSIQLNHVRADEAADVAGRPAEQEPTAIPRFFTVSTYPIMEVNDKLIVAVCQAYGENPWRKAPFSKCLNWEGRLQEHLQAIAELELPARVYLIGKGSKSVVGIYQNTNAIWDWCYIIPYDQS